MGTWAATGISKRRRVSTPGLRGSLEKKNTNNQLQSRRFQESNPVLQSHLRVRASKSGVRAHENASFGKLRLPSIKSRLGRNAFVVQKVRKLVLSSVNIKDSL